MLNKVLLQGRLTADPEPQNTQSGIAVVSFCLACDRNFADKNGNRAADFIPCVAWRKTADFVAKYFSKGQQAIVEGSLQSRRYTDKDGNKRTVYEVVADQVYFCGSKQEKSRTQVDFDIDDFEEIDNSDCPF